MTLSINGAMGDSHCRIVYNSLLLEDTVSKNKQSLVSSHLLENRYGGLLGLL